jgi:hypothetical protein
VPTWVPTSDVPCFRGEGSSNESGTTLEFAGCPGGQSAHADSDHVEELRDRLNNYLDLGAEDLIAADEGFNFAGRLQATLADAVEHTAWHPGVPRRDPAQRLLSTWRSGRRAERLSTCFLDGAAAASQS